MQRMKSTLLALVVALAPAVAAAQQPGAPAMLTTRHFAFFSDLPTNVNDALIAAAIARGNKQPEPLSEGTDKACFDALPANAREGWTRAVDYYAMGKSSNFQRVLLR